MERDVVERARAYVDYIDRRRDDCELSEDGVNGLVRGLLPEIESLRSEVARLRAQVGWRPIETAPKDGTDILLWEKWGDVPFVGFWHAEGRWSYRSDHLYVNGDASLDPNWNDLTHWMPLPAPPDSDTPAEPSPEDHLERARRRVGAPER